MGEGGGESRIHPPPLYPLPRGEGIFLKSDKRILRLKRVSPIIDEKKKGCKGKIISPL
jgi:hypothetical protein